MSHTPHILAAVFLCELWLPVGALISATYNPPWRCSFFGFTDRLEYLANPYLRQQYAVAGAEKARQRQRIDQEREGSTVQERIAYLIGDNKVALILGAAGIFGIIAIAVLLGFRVKQHQLLINWLSERSKRKPLRLPIVELLRKTVDYSYRQNLH